MNNIILNTPVSDSTILNKVHIYNYMIIITKNCTLKITSNKGDDILIPQGNIAFIEKNNVFSVRINRCGNNELYESLHLDDDIVTDICKSIEPLVTPSLLGSSFLSERNINKKVFFIPYNEIELNIFENLKNKKLSKYNTILKCIYLFSKVTNISDMLISLRISSRITFVDQVKKIIEKDLQKKWTLNELSILMNLAEISIRKKLEAESMTFNNLLLDIRMNSALKMLTKNPNHINIIAKNTGYSSVSYFIKTFKSYYGITPKQFRLNIK
ncbi:helix-turn-helix domain-containing protein [Providencia alcalifaciens]|uniref:helix-turn-helix domain-containing protein n=1 Tax=Providencia alcalifaciens TaxID=126385 RepID=UPI0004460B5B|nr:helix-turn-helix domain-containing protein [Providencia alcalifaciens]EUD07258.1 putative virulence regulon transcriptional activator VirF [Providencia alcalifaciens R90-1475]